MILCDSNVLIELFKGNKNTLETLKSIGSKNIGISAVLKTTEISETTEKF